MAIGDPLL
ncbi:unnamed protein product [Linum tenue]|uniref:Uncharacterized protein n=1 Tax=Linum tenue TaxID=586396 RepID=A0AAV0KI92_9ROSI|nr:unnamed protein product [Linum tenue]